MGLRAEFAMHHSGFEEFLFAPVWEEKSGTPLSILSAFTRLGIDPWPEAARLAGMPRAGAAAALAAILARLPRTGLQLPDYSGLARRLVAFLPQRSTASAEQRGNGRLDLGKLKLGVIVALAVLVFLQANGWLL